MYKSSMKYMRYLTSKIKCLQNHLFENTGKKKVQNFYCIPEKRHDRYPYTHRYTNIQRCFSEKIETKLQSQLKKQLHVFKHNDFVGF